jgi:hypothetical protein
MSTPSQARARHCPGWCVLQHERFTGEEDLVHVSEPQSVRNTVVRLCMTVEPATGRHDGPYVLLGGDEYSLDEAADLVEVLRELLGVGRLSSRRAGS